MEVIQSADNPIIKEVKKLKEKRFRSQYNQFLVEGFRFTEEALKSEFRVSKVILSEESLIKFQELNFNTLIQKETKLHIVKDNLFKALCSTETPQGIIGVVENKFIEPENKSGFYILADKIQDPGNMGTIIRTADAAGALGVIYTKGTVDIYNEKTLRSTMGSIFHIPIIYDENLDITKGLRENGFKVVVSSLEAESNFFQLKFKDKIIIAVGNEGSGIGKEVYELGDLKTKIPMPGKAESLNVSIAASIMMYEYIRQNTR